MIILFDLIISIRTKTSNEFDFKQTLRELLGNSFYDFIDGFGIDLFLEMIDFIVKIFIKLFLFLFSLFT